MADESNETMSPEQIAQLQAQNCIFCKIVKNEIPARKVFEDSRALCIMDIYPAAKGHLLLMPKEHYPFLPAIDADTAAHLYKLVGEICVAAKKAVVTDRATVFIANGAVAGQQSPHFLIHIIPRDKEDLLANFDLPANDALAPDVQGVANSIKQRLAGIIASDASKVLTTQDAAGNIALRPILHSSANQKGHAQQVSNQEASSKDLLSGQAVPERISLLANLILENPELKRLLESNPEGFLAETNKYPELQALFKGIDIQKLANTLKDIK